MNSNKLFNLSKWKISLFFGVTLAIALVLRFSYVFQDAITFGYDQARDAFTAFQILGGDIKIQGPPVSLGGFYHGVLYFYLIAPIYGLAHGNPQFVQAFLILINLLGIIPLYLWAKKMFNTQVALISCLLYAFSFDVIQYSTWLSNPSPAVVFASLFFYGLYLYLFSPRHHTLGLIMSAVFLGLSIQSQFFLGYLVIPLVVSLKVFHKLPSLKDTIQFGTLLLMSVSTMILSYIKFGPTFIKGFKLLLATPSTPAVAGLKFMEIFGLMANRFAENFYRNIFPINAAFGGIFGIFAIYLAYRLISSKHKYASALLFLIIIILSQAFVIPFGGQSTPHVNVGLQTPIIILSAFIFYYLYTKDKALGIFLVTASLICSLSIHLTNVKNAQVIFAIQKPLLLDNEKQVIDAAYQLADHKPFSINTITSPFWVNTTWAYLFNWYGQAKYGYTPSFHGRDQVGFLGNMPAPTAQDQTYIVITEPDTNAHPDMISNTYQYEDSFSKVLETKNINGILIEKRLLTRDFSKINFVK